MSNCTEPGSRSLVILRANHRTQYAVSLQKAHLPNDQALEQIEMSCKELIQNTYDQYEILISPSKPPVHTTTTTGATETTWELAQAHTVNRAFDKEYPPTGLQTSQNLSG